jgi:ATPase family AAA domain-containing protein 3A/B
MFTPSLVRETSRYNVMQRVRAAFGFGGPTPVAMDSALRQADRTFSDVVLAPEVKHSIRTLAASAANTRLHGAPFRHYLLYGVSPLVWLPLRCSLWRSQACIPAPLLPRSPHL